MRRAFGHRSARVISVSRFAFAAAFLTIVWVDPGQPAPTAYVITYSVLSAYVVWSALIVYLTWSNWWLDLRLRKPAHFLDLITLAATAVVTEGLTSPFFTFFVFLVLSALQKFGALAAAWTAAAAIILYTVFGAASVYLGISSPDWDRFLLRRGSIINDPTREAFTPAVRLRASPEAQDTRVLADADCRRSNLVSHA
jgi:hypothetical protein